MQFTEEDTGSPQRGQTSDRPTDRPTASNLSRRVPVSPFAYRLWPKATASLVVVAAHQSSPCVSLCASAGPLLRPLS
jgi:hypothetical protein